MTELHSSSEGCSGEEGCWDLCVCLSAVRYTNEIIELLKLLLNSSSCVVSRTPLRMCFPAHPFSSSTAAELSDNILGKKLLVGASFALCAHDFSEATELAFVVVRYF